MHVHCVVKVGRGGMAVMGNRKRSVKNGPCDWWMNQGMQRQGPHFMPKSVHLQCPATPPFTCCMYAPYRITASHSQPELISPYLTSGISKYGTFQLFSRHSERGCTNFPSAG